MSLRFTLQQRFNLAFILLTILVAASSGAGLWFAASVEGSLRAVRQASQRLDQVSDLQAVFQSTIRAVDSMLLSRSIATYETQLDANVIALNNSLEILTQAILNPIQPINEENRAILPAMKQINSDLQATINEFKTIAASGRWGSALTLRQTELAASEREMNDRLQSLSTSIRNEVNVQVNETTLLQNQTRSYWLISTIFATALALLIAWLVNRWIVNPIHKLTSAAQSVTANEITPLEAMTQQDEIGDLSRAMTMMTSRLYESAETLEKRVTERTQDLARRTTQLQVAAEVARDIASTQKLEDLLDHAVNLIRDSFGFYHAGIFLTDEANEFAVLRAATGEAGEEMLRQGHKLGIGETGLVGHVTKTGKARVALDVGQDAVHFKNPLLPDTRSEAALPLIHANRVVGALDVQSVIPAAFDEDSIAILQVITDQLAIAIQNARLLQEVQDNLRELQAFYQDFDRSAWEKSFQKGSPTEETVLGYEFDGINLKPLIASELTKSTSQAASQEGQPMRIPLVVRGTIIGNLEVWPKLGELSASEVFTLASIGSRLSQSLESAKLFEETQSRAAREQVLSTITASLRSSLDLKTVLQTAVREIGEKLGLSQVDIYLGSAQDGNQPAKTNED